MSETKSISDARTNRVFLINLKPKYMTGNMAKGKYEVMKLAVKFVSEFRNTFQEKKSRMIEIMTMAYQAAAALPLNRDQ